MKCFGAWLTPMLGFLLVWHSAGAKAVLEASTKGSAKVNCPNLSFPGVGNVLQFRAPCASAALDRYIPCLLCTFAQAVQVYADGSLADGWHDSSKGCMKCTWASASEVLNTCGSVRIFGYCVLHSQTTASLAASQVGHTVDSTAEQLHGNMLKINLIPSCTASSDATV